MSNKIAVLVGSLRTESYARKIAHNVIEMLPEKYEGYILEIGDLPLYDADYDDPAYENKPLPESYTKFREAIKEAAGVIFVTPENNRTIPAVLKNAVDVGSKPNGDVAWTNTPTAIISHSVGKLGGYSSNKNLRLALSYFKMPIVQQPEVFLGNSPTLLDDEGKFNNQGTIDFVQGYIDEFISLVEKEC